MSNIKVWCEVVCDRCGMTLEGRFYDKGVIGKLRNSAKESRWKVINGDTVCPRCAEIQKKKEVKP